MMLVPLADNLGIMWVATEGSTLASVLLVTFYNQKTSFEAGWKYIIIGSVGISLALFGTVLTYYSAVGVLGADTQHGMNWSVLAGIAASFDPARDAPGLHPGAAGLRHQGRPGADAHLEARRLRRGACAHGRAAGGGVHQLRHLWHRPLRRAGGKMPGARFPGRLLAGFGVASILVAAPFVLAQRNFRRLLAYSSIDHAGIMVAALGFGGRLGALGATLHMLFHAVTKPLLFFCAGNVQQHYGTPYFRKVRGVLHTLPWTGGLFPAGRRWPSPARPPSACFKASSPP